jgi:hypothetical protein
MQKQLVRELESQERRRVDEANAALMLQYEDLLWRAAETSASEADLLADADVRATLSLVNKPIAGFVADLADIRERIALQSQIEQSLAAEVESDELKASLAAIDAEEAAAVEAFEARRRPLRQQLRDCKRRVTETAHARKHYRVTAPDWLRKRVTAIGERLLKLDRSKRPQPTKPTPPGQSLAAPDAANLPLREQQHADRMAQYFDLMAEWKEEEAERKPTVALLESEQALLRSLMLRLRPVEADVENG